MESTVEVVWYGGQRGSWCQAIVEYLTEGFAHVDGSDAIKGDGAIVVVKADQVGKHVQEFNLYCSGLKWALVIVTANEDGTWPWQQFRHRNSLVWLQTPHKTQHAHRFLPWGWTPGCAQEMRTAKLWDWSFAGQITHSRREEFLKVARTMDSSRRVLVTSKGFAQGISQDAYYKILAASKVAPCPSGPITVDSMRVCEALQLGAIPVLDASSPTGSYPEYWDRVFGEDRPFLSLTAWDGFPHRMGSILTLWDECSPSIREWWRGWKVNLKVALNQDLKDLGAI